MHASQGRGRRHQDTMVDDDDVLSRMAARGRRDAQRGDAYGRSSYPHHAEGYSAPGAYDADASSSHRRASDWRDDPAMGALDAYHAGSTDPYGRLHRTDRERADYADDGWTSRPVSNRYTTSTRNWEEPYEAGYPSKSSYPDTGWSQPAHSTRSHASQDARHTGYDWAQEDPRWLQSTQGGQGHEREAPGWERREDQRDAGWDTRQRHKDRQDVPQRQWGAAQGSRAPPLEEDRAWEPSANWQPGQTSRRPEYSQDQRQGHRYQNNRNHNHGGNYQQQARNKTNKKKNKQRNKQQHQHQQNREGDAAGGPANNWTRRDATNNNNNNGNNNKGKRELGKQRWDRPPSRSRSRSPAHSYTSRRSSRSRSRSASASPRRSKRDSGNAESRSPDVTRSAKKRWPPPDRDRRSQSRSASPPSPTERPRRRNRSTSTTSRSRSRSPTRSPDPRPKASHRLPTMTALDSLSMHGARLPPVRAWRQQDAESRRAVIPLAIDPPEALPNAPAMEATTSTSSSIPPELTPTVAVATPAAVPQEPKPEVAFAPPTATSMPATTSPEDSPTKVAAAARTKPGFKPIGHGNSAVKRFFPGEEDDVDMQIADTSTESIQPPPQKVHIVGEKAVAVAAPIVEGQHSAGPASFRPSPADGLPPSSSDREMAPAVFVNGHAVAIDDGAPAAAEQPSARDHTGAAPVAAAPAAAAGRPEKLYSFVSQVGEGTFGKVYKARNQVTGVHVALKRIRMETERDGFPVTAMREIKLLQSLSHENIIRLHEMMVSEGNVYMVFEYMDHDLTGVLSQTQFSFSDAHLKSLCAQMLRGLAYLHHKGVVHRDIKGSNILLNNRGQLKLADFGLARFYQKRRKADYTNRVITLWYRPPELLLGTTVYGPEVDMWSAGCIMLELFCKKPVFQGNDEIHQLDVIYKILGTPTPERWPGVVDLPWYEIVKPREALPNRFRMLFQAWLSPAALDLAEQLLEYDPAKRVSAMQALEAPYFHQEQPPAELPVQLSELKGEWHELETKRERERAKKRRKTEEGA